MSQSGDTPQPGFVDSFFDGVQDDELGEWSFSAEDRAFFAAFREECRFVWQAEEEEADAEAEAEARAKAQGAAPAAAGTDLSRQPGQTGPDRGQCSPQSGDHRPRQRRS